MGAGRQFRQLGGRQLDRVPGTPGLGGHFPGAVDQKVGPVRIRLGQSRNEGFYKIILLMFFWLYSCLYSFFFVI